MKTSNLEYKLINYFILIAFAALLIGIEFYFEIHSKEITRDIYHSVAANLNDATATTNYNELEPIINLGNKIFVMFCVLMFVVAIVLTMFIKNITLPLRGIVDVAQRVNMGDLSQTVQVVTQDEIGEVGAAINELTSNFQEVATFTISTVNHTIGRIKEIEDNIKTRTVPDMQTVDDIKQSIIALNDFLSTLQVLKADIRN